MTFTPRLTRPEAGNKYYITKSAGGWSPCIIGSPTDKDCNVLSNCVGYAVGRFNEIARRGRCDLLPNVDAERFYDNCPDLKKGTEPKAGAVICWGQGDVKNAADGHGHVAIVEKVVSDTEIVCSESAWKGTAFRTVTRKKGSGNWTKDARFKFRGFIYQPGEVTEAAPEKATLRVGDSVRVKAGARGYGGERLAPFVYLQTYTVMETGSRDPNRIVIGQNGTITAAVKAENLIKV